MKNIKGEEIKTIVSGKTTKVVRKETFEENERQSIAFL